MSLSSQDLQRCALRRNRAIETGLLAAMAFFVYSPDVRSAAGFLDSPDPRYRGSLRGRRPRRLVRRDCDLPPTVGPADPASRNRAEEQGTHRRGPGELPRT